MEPPDEARLVQVWRPKLAPIAELVLRRAPDAGDWRLRAADGCDPLGAWLGKDADPVQLWACEEPASQAQR